ncbi:hypothetical protein Tco_0242069 [Tanacetum coccineum]
MFQQHQGESLFEAWTHFKDLLRKVPHHGIDLWLQMQIFYDRIDHTLKRIVDYAAKGRLSKISAEKAWATIEELARYEEEGWNDPVARGEGSFDYENPDIEQLLGIIERKVDTLMKDAISLMGRSESVFWMTTNEMYRPPFEPSRQEEFEHIVMNFILDQEKRVKQLEEYMEVIMGDFMQLSSKVTRRLKEKIIEEGRRMRKIEKITWYHKKHFFPHLQLHPVKITLCQIRPHNLTQSTSCNTPKNVSQRNYVRGRYFIIQQLKIQENDEHNNYVISMVYDARSYNGRPGIATTKTLSSINAITMSFFKRIIWQSYDV